MRVLRYQVSVESGGALASDLDTPPLAEVGTTPAEVAEATASGDRPGEAEPGMEGLLKGPYVAETFPVTIEQQYVMVEIGR